MNDIINSWFLLFPLLGYSICIIIGVFFLISLFIGGSLLIACLCIYGLYLFLRDSTTAKRYYADYLNIKDYIKESVNTNIKSSFHIKGSIDSLPEGPALYLCHPHGLLSITWFLHFCLRVTSWPSTKIPKVAISSIFFRFPIIKELAESNNAIPAGEEAIIEALQKGDSVAVLLGGVDELYHSLEDGPMKLVLEKRKGYARIARKTGVPLIPLITFGEERVFPSLKWGPWVSFQKMLYHWFHILIPLPTLQSILRWSTIVRKPLDEPIETHILEPILSKDVSIKILRKRYSKRIREFAVDKNIIIID